MPNFLVDALNQMLIMQKASCRVQDIKLCTQDVQYYGAVSYKHKSLKYRIKPGNAPHSTFYGAD